MIPGLFLNNPLTTCVSVVTVLLVMAYSWPLPEWDEEITVAFLGNSMQYYNDFPRFMQALSAGQISQESCLHGDANIPNLLRNGKSRFGIEFYSQRIDSYSYSSVILGNGMYDKWNTSAALITGPDGEEVFDFGACSVRQTLFGDDPVLEAYDGSGEYDQFLNPHNETYYGDGTNPCHEDPNYLRFTMEAYHHPEAHLPKWDYIVINDNTQSAGEYESRRLSLHVLHNTYVGWFKQTGATPVFWFTYAYWSPLRNLTKFRDVPTFTSLTYAGYRKYAEVVGAQLPESQRPRIAPMGLAFLTIWEENYDFWLTLFHWDLVHPSPSGSFLEGLVMHHTLYGRLPKRSSVLVDDMSTLWSTVRLMGPSTEPPKPFPTKEEATYLFRIAERITQEGHIPSSLIIFENGESVDGDRIRTDDGLFLAYAK